MQFSVFLYGIMINSAIGSEISTTLIDIITNMTAIGDLCYGPDINSAITEYGHTECSVIVDIILSLSHSLDIDNLLLVCTGKNKFWHILCYAFHSKICIIIKQLPLVYQFFRVPFSNCPKLWILKLSVMLVNVHNILVKFCIENISKLFYFCKCPNIDK